MMNTAIPLIFALGIGFRHAFEADHLLAISNIVTQRGRSSTAIIDGLFWGLGHTTTIFLIGALIVLGKWVIASDWFEYMEGVVGIVLTVLGLWRLWQASSGIKKHKGHGYGLAYGIGLIHGLAGSGAIVLLAMVEVQGNMPGLMYLLSFGVGSTIGMLLVAGLISFPISKQFLSGILLQRFMILLSSVLCIGYGFYLIYASFLLE